MVYSPLTNDEMKAAATATVTLTTDSSTSNGLTNDAATNKDIYKNRRRMAWVSLISILVVMLLVLFWLPVPRLEAIKDIIGWFMMAMASVVGAYMAVTTWLDVAMTNKVKKPGV